jgi:DNA processing protein
MPPAQYNLSDTERLDWLRLSRTEHVGPIVFRQLIARFGNAKAALDALPELARRGGRARPVTPFPVGAAERELAALARHGGRFVACGEPDYPAPLAALEDAPPLISLVGDAALLARHAIAVVGARNASTNGRRFAEDIARDLGQRGFAVVSGLARGIDSAAHRGSLATGTVAVVAGGADVVYPPENEALQRAIGEQGALIAELAPGTQPQARHFPRRNRVIAGLSLGVVVVEAAIRSGSLITARFALEQGRQVMAVPGSPLDPRCRGTNHLIRQGAALIESADDVMTALEGMAPPRSAGPPRPVVPPPLPVGAADDGLAAARGAIAEQLGPTPVAVDELLRQCHLSAASVNTVLLELELAGRLERHPGNRVCLVSAGD